MTRRSACSPSNGYDATSVNQIIVAVGVSKGAFYHHFESKEDLVEALACRYARHTAAADRAGTARDPTLDAFSKLTGFLGTMRRHKTETAAELRATFEPMFRAENLQLFERTQRAVAEVVQPILTRIIVEGVAEQTFDTPDPEGAAETIMHLMTSNRELVVELYQTRDRLHFERLSQRLLAKMAVSRHRHRPHPRPARRQHRAGRPQYPRCTRLCARPTADRRLTTKDEG